MGVIFEWKVRVCIWESTALNYCKIVAPFRLTIRYLPSVPPYTPFTLYFPARFSFFTSFGLTFFPLCCGHGNLSTRRFIGSVFKCLFAHLSPPAIALLYNCAAYNIICQMWLANYGHGHGLGAGARFQFNASLNWGKLKAGWEKRTELATITENWKAYILHTDGFVAIKNWPLATGCARVHWLFFFLFLTVAYCSAPGAEISFSFFSIIYWH